MKPKSLVKTALLVFVVGSIAFLAVKESRRWAASSGVAAQDQRPAEGTSTAVTPAAKPQANKIIAYYFHTTYRCDTCRRIEAYSKEAINSGFARELADGKLEFQLVNVELPENQHFAQDYKLVTKSVVLVRMKDGKQIEWTNLSRIWELTGDRDAFLRYVQEGIRTYLEKS